MGFKCGIVGLPNVGKSTLFNALTNAGIEAANYPFCTIEPNTGVVPVPDTRLARLAEIVNPKRVIPTTMEFVDIAGLVAGAAKGEGLGNKFLAHIRETDAIAHVVRCFENDDITHVSGKVNPIDDIETIHTELALADLESVTKALTRIQKLAKSGDKIALLEQKALDKVKAHLDEGQLVRTLELTDAEKPIIRNLHLITIKPTLYIANVHEDGLTNSPYLRQVEEHAAKENAKVVAICASIEEEIAQLDESEKAEFLSELGLEESGLDRIIHAGHSLLGLQTYFTAGEKEVRAWTIKVGDTAPKAAAKIHTDFEKGFIRAEIIGYNDFVTHKGEQGAKDAGKWRLEGKEYIVQDGDVIHFRFNI